MGTKTIGLDEDAYERLAAESHDDESFSETVKRITEEVSSDWRRGFGRYGSSERGAEAFVETIEEVRHDRAEGIGAGHSETLEALGIDTSDHYATPDDTGSESGGETGYEDGDETGRESGH